MTQEGGRKRVVVDHVGPQVDCGRFPVKRAVGEALTVTAHIFADGHDHTRAELLYRRRSDASWMVLEMAHRVNDEWAATFEITELVDHIYTVRAWVDRFDTWQSDLRKKVEADQDVQVDLQIGSALLHAAAKRAKGPDAERLEQWARALQNDRKTEGATELALSAQVGDLVRAYPDRSLATSYEKELVAAVDREKALFSAWYEFFPRSFGDDGKHGTFRSGERWLPEIAKMGFDVVYLPPIHPIGKTKRKGKNNATVCTPNDPGSPWAIGSRRGGHKAIHPDLGTLAGFRRFVEKAKQHDLEIAMDLAFQCSPDHPYVEDHPEWFRWRPDGTVQFAENPPKKYEDILPLNFESESWRDLWEELKSVVLFWIDQGVRIFRVDNPHTKPFGFWQWLIGEVRCDYPDVIFLAEAFTRPKVMQRLAKVGFNQSYTYFTWRNTKWEIERYIQELAHTEVGEYMRPSFWPNTPDILPQYLQYGGRAAFITRLILAATLSSNYGIYGPAFELCVNEAVEGKEEYLDSEKYELKQWDWNRKGNIRSVVARVNRVRRENPALRGIRNIRLCHVDNEAILCYGKMSEDRSNVTLTVVSIDPHYRQSGWITLPLDEMDIDPRQPFLAHDLLSDDKYIWQGERNYIELDPQVMPGHILRIQRRLRRETDFDYFM
jgi:starch synthase (maltosyl-transferring)